MPFVVAASTGGVLYSPLLPLSPSHALITLTISAFVLAIGLALVFMLLTCYFLRLLLHGIPSDASVISTFIPLGPMGQGGYTLLLLGQGFRATLPLQPGLSSLLRDPATGQMIEVLCVCTSFVLWAFASMWFVYAVLGVREVLRHKSFPFKLSVWGMIFPLVSR